MRQTETAASHQRTASDVARQAGAGALSDATRVERAITMRIRAARPRPARPVHTVRAVIASSDAQCADFTGTQALQRWIGQVPSLSGGTSGSQWDATTAEASLHATSTFAWDEGTQTIRRDGDLPPDEGQTAGVPPPPPAPRRSRGLVRGRRHTTGRRHADHHSGFLRRPAGRRDQDTDGRHRL